MNFQHLENLLIRFRGQTVNIQAVSGATYDGVIVDVTNDYVILKGATAAELEQITVLLHAIESIKVAAKQ